MGTGRAVLFHQDQDRSGRPASVARKSVKCCPIILSDTGDEWVMGSWSAPPLGSSVAIRIGTLSSGVQPDRSLDDHRPPVQVILRRSRPLTQRGCRHSPVVPQLSIMYRASATTRKKAGTDPVQTLADRPRSRFYCVLSGVVSSDVSVPCSLGFFMVWESATSPVMSPRPIELRTGAGTRTITALLLFSPS